LSSKINQMQQIKLRLDDEVINHLKDQAELHGIPFNTLCQKILAAGATEAEVLIVSPHRLDLQLDRLVTSLRSLEKQSI
jgi:hypothetical protein